MSAMQRETGNTVVSISDACVYHRDAIALEATSLEVRRGEFVGIIGPNGAGKTTLLTLVNGLGTLSSGRVRVNGMDPFGRQRHRLRRSVAYVAQRPFIDPRLPISVFETVMSGSFGRVGWLKRPSLDERRHAMAALERVGIDHLADRPIGKLSGGEYQRVAIARSLVQEPELFLFDEPTAAIDPQAQDEILDLIQGIHRQSGCTALYVTHDLATLPEACRRLILMKDGRIWADGPREAMLTRATLDALYGRHGPAALKSIAGAGT
jgi:ABC-type Mn2+/Zn2+ transport system ATPase subunit